MPETQHMLYAGVGSRETPPAVQDFMRDIAARLARRAYLLRSGAADGADTAFEDGCKAVGGRMEIWLPWKGFNEHADTGFYPTEAHAAVAATVHPAWDRLTRGPRALHSRNVGQVLGRGLDQPVSFVLCWTRDGCINDATRTEDTGGTATAIVLAARRGIPVFNLFNPKDPQQINREVVDRLTLHVLADCRPFHLDGSLPQHGEILVFGSNLAGRHGKGSAEIALKRFGAVYGQGQGLQGQSYGIATKDGRPGTPALADVAATLPLPVIRDQVIEFLKLARSTPDKRYFVVRLGCVLAAHEDADIAPLFAAAPSNCSFSDAWRPWLGPRSAVPTVATPDPRGDGINIWSGTKGLGGALTNMSELARKRGNIQFGYPVQIGKVQYPDAEAAYQALKRHGEASYNDGLMIDIIALKFRQNAKLLKLVTDKGGLAWLGRCSHFTGAKTEGFKSWEGQGVSSRFICNLMHGYQKALSGEGPATRVAHVKDAPYDIYIGRKNGDLPASIWANSHQIGKDGTREEVVLKYYRDTLDNPELMARIHELRNRTLGCWCKTKDDPHALCHGDVLVALAEGREFRLPERVQGSLF